MKLILASQSPRRSQILSDAGFDFVVQPTNAPEEIRTNEDPKDTVLRLAKEKGFFATQNCKVKNTIILTADTIVVLDKKILGKPVDKEDARSMITGLSGKSHQVFTAWCLIKQDGTILSHDLDESSVTFRQLSHDEIENFICTDEPYDKAGGYGIQGQASDFVVELSGSIHTVIGLPIEKLTPVLKSALSS